MKKKILFFSLISVCLFQNCFSQNAKTVRGPYLQILTPTSVTIRWRTDSPTDSKVFFGALKTKIYKELIDKNQVTEHTITLTGLTPETKYFYSFGSTKSDLKSDTEQYFKTAPSIGSTIPIRIWALGDFGNNSKNQLDCRDAILKKTTDHRPDVWIWLGDNAYSNGEENEFQKHVFDVYQNSFFKNTPFFATPGNHDYAGKYDPELPPYFKIVNMPKNGESGGVPSGSESYYSFDYGNVHFVSLDSQGALDGGQFLYDTTGKQVNWLKKDLLANKQQWTIVFWHHPPYSKGSHDSDTEEVMVKIRQNLLPILERFKVDIVFGGHSHVYERTAPILGHYGLSESFIPEKHIISESDSPDNYHIKNKRQGIIYIVNGSGGQIGGQEQGYPLKAAVYSNNTVGGSMILDVKGNYLKAQWICSDGVIRDTFSILKD